MHTILTHLSVRPLDGLIDNHARYARAHGYRHVTADANHIYGERQRTLHSYHCIYHELQSLPDGELLLVLNQFAVIYAPHSLSAVAEGYDFIVTNQTQDSPLATPTGMIFRKTPEVMERMHKLLAYISHWANYGETWACTTEAHLLAEIFPPHPFTNRLNNGFFSCVQAAWLVGFAIDSLRSAQPLIAHHSPQWELLHGQWAPRVDFDFRYNQALLEEARLPHAPSAFEEYEKVNAQEREPAIHVNPEAPIAFVTLYTPNIAGYGVQHEQSLIRYCQRHGYAYHAYRSTPAFVTEGITANWAKAHLIRHHLPQHEFVMWIDSDIMAINQSLSMDSPLAGRDFIIGKDHTPWPINSCLFGMRNTPAMHELLNDLCARIEAVQDRSGVYASGGDQQTLMDGMLAANLLDARHVLNAIDLAASPVYATPENRFVHFPVSLGHYRALSMRIWDRLSHAR